MMQNGDAVKLALDHTHCRAICDEVGERLRMVLKVPEMPSYLCRLMDRLAELDREASPSIAPSIDDMCFEERPAVLGYADKRSEAPRIKA
jgi:hypothetical protein